jgi:hypothetical protein
MPREDIDRHDLDNLKELFQAHFKTIEVQLKEMNRALELAAEETKRRNLEFNDVERRFLDKKAFETYVATQTTERKSDRRFFLTAGIATAGVVAGVVARIFGS